MTRAGTLFVVATPLGNLADITQRAIEALSRARLVACEDTRRSRRLLTHFGIRPPRIISCHKFNERGQVRPILETLRAGEDVALVSDSGTPGLSDPGSLVVDEALRAGLPVSPVPGPSAVAAAISVCGFRCPGFVFVGFLPPKGPSRREALAAMRGERRPMVLFEAPHRISRTSADLLASLGDREVTLLREATKVHEEVLRTTLKHLADRHRAGGGRGEYTLVIEGGAGEPEEAEPPGPEGLRERYDRLLGEGVERREALRILARETGLPRREIYAVVLARHTNNDAGNGPS